MKNSDSVPPPPPPPPHTHTECFELRIIVFACWGDIIYGIYIPIVTLYGAASVEAMAIAGQPCEVTFLASGLK